MEKKKKIHVYPIFLAVYVIVVLVAAMFPLKKLWRYAEEYEISQPSKTMDVYVQELNANLWNEQVAETISAMPHEVQSDEECAGIVKELLGQGITYVRTAGDGSGETVNYALRVGDSVIGKVKLAEDRSKADEMQFDMLPWIVVDEEFDFNGLYNSIQVTVPNSYKVTLNGIELGSDHIIEDGIQFQLLKDYYESYSKLPVMVTYSFDHIIGELEPVIYNDKNEQVQIDETQGEEQFLSNCSEEETARLTDFTERFAERYLYYTSGVSSEPEAALKRLSPYISVGSDLEDRMKIALDGYGWTHTSSFNIEYTALNSVVSFGDGVYLCDFSAKYSTSGANGAEEQEYKAKIIVIDTNGDMRVADLSMYK